MSVAEIQKMTVNERLETMEKLWESLSQNDTDIESPAWHKEVLDSRRKHIDSGDAQFYTIEEVKAHFKK